MKSLIHFEQTARKYFSGEAAGHQRVIPQHSKKQLLKQATECLAKLGSTDDIRIVYQHLVSYVIRDKPENSPDLQKSEEYPSFMRIWSKLDRHCHNFVLEGNFSSCFPLLKFFKPCSVPRKQLNHLACKGCTKFKISCIFSPNNWVIVQTLFFFK